MEVAVFGLPDRIASGKIFKRALKSHYAALLQAGQPVAAANTTNGTTQE